MAKPFQNCATACASGCNAARRASVSDYQLMTVLAEITGAFTCNSTIYDQGLYSNSPSAPYFNADGNKCVAQLSNNSDCTTVASGNAADAIRQICCCGTDSDCPLIPPTTTT